GDRQRGQPEQLLQRTTDGVDGLDPGHRRDAPFLPQPPGPGVDGFVGALPALHAVTPAGHDQDVRDADHQRRDERGDQPGPRLLEHGPRAHRARRRPARRPAMPARSTRSPHAGPPDSWAHAAVTIVPQARCEATARDQLSVVLSSALSWAFRAVRRRCAVRAIAWLDTGDVNATNTMASAANVMIRMSSVAIDEARMQMMPGPVARPCACNCPRTVGRRRTPSTLM